MSWEVAPRSASANFTERAPGKTIASAERKRVRITILICLPTWFSLVASGGHGVVKLRHPTPDPSGVVTDVAFELPMKQGTAALVLLLNVSRVVAGSRPTAASRIVLAMSAMLFGQLLVTPGGLFMQF